METIRIKEFISELIKDKFLSGDDSKDLSYDTLLLDERIIDSSGVLMLIMKIEKEFNIQIDDDELVPENFNSINILSDLVSSKIVTT
jgi:acyl carrier protein